MKKLKLKLKFFGKNYSGWQKQNQSERTVQGELEKALSTIYKAEVKTVGSGRTDAKVHSLDHHVSFEAPFDIPHDKIVKALNGNLPEDIRVYECIDVSDSFRPTNDAKKKEYRYLFTNFDTPSPFIIDQMSNISYELDFSAMKQACSLFVGEHDFVNFHCTGSDPSSTTRVIYTCEIIKCKGDDHGIWPEHYCIRVVGNGFLKQMVRLIVGAVWSVGRGKISLDTVQNALKLIESGHISAVAPAQGLYKYKVEY